MPCRRAITAAFLIVCGSPSLGDDYPEAHKACYEGDIPDKVITACSVVIDSSGLDSKELATALKHRADAYDDKHKHELALKDFDRAMALDPDDAGLFNSRGATLIALGRYREAIDDFNRALKLKPALAMAISNRCFAEANLGQLDEAMVDCNNAIALAPESAGAKAARAFVYLKLKRPEEAIRDCDAVLAMREDPYCLFGRAVAKRMQGHLRESDADVVRATAIKPDIAEHMARFGLHLQQDK